MSNPVGLILAGGQSRRMGGGDKALMPFSSRRMIDHVIARAQPQVSRLLINSPNPELETDAIERVIDIRADFQGPLAGIEAGLCALNDGEEWLATFACDAPFVPIDFVQRCLAAVGSNHAEVLLAQSAGRSHPVAGLWHKSLRTPLTTFLDGGERKVDVFTATRREARVSFSIEAGIDPFLNLNRPEDLANAEALLT